MTNYYKILGVSDFASMDEIKTAYRKLSKKFHPDVNEGDKFFEERFKEIQSAYEALNDSAKKGRLDDFLRQTGTQSNFQTNQNQAKTESTSSNTGSRNNANSEKRNSESEKEEPKKEKNTYESQTVDIKKPKTNNYAFFFGVIIVVVVGVIIAANKTKKTNYSNNTEYSQPKTYSPPTQSYNDYSSSTSESYNNSNNESYYSNSDISVNRFSIGSTKKEVLSIQGNPTSTNKYEVLNQEIWYFGRSSVTFTGGKVSEYSDYGQNLRVQYSDNSNVSEESFSKTNFSIGSTKKEVLSVQGNPTSTNKYEVLNQEIWYYGRSSVTFTGGKVSEYSDYGQNLRVQYSDNSNVSEESYSKAYFSIGSSKKEVLSVQGNPTSTNKYEVLNQEIWYYGRSSVTFTGGKVSEYSDYGHNLRVQY